MTNLAEVSPVTTKKLEAGTMLNRSGHEDDDYIILTKAIEVRVVGKVRREGLPVVVTELGLDQILFLHQPESKRQRVKNNLSS